MSEYVCKSPVLVCGFNRPDLLANCLEHVKRVNPPKVYIAIDGPRSRVKGDNSKVEACRQLAASIDWCSEVHLKIEPENLGCRRAIEGALDWFFNAEPEGIILEDDIEATPEFFQFCDILLDRYRSDESIGCINGWTPVPPGLTPKDSAYLTRYAHIWGWAAWRRTWQAARRNSSSLTRSSLRNGTLLTRSYGRGIDQYWSNLLELISEGHLDTWDVPFGLKLAAEGRLSVSPPVSLTTNLGFGPGSTHTRHSKNPFRNKSSQKTYSLSTNQVPVSSTDLDWAHDKYAFGFGEGVNYWPRLKSKLNYYLHIVPFGKSLITTINRFR